MKRLLFSGLITLWAFTLISWSPLARRTIALIAENQLTVRSKLALQEILSIKTLADVNISNHTATNNFFRQFNENLYTTAVPASPSMDQFGNAVKEMRVNQIQVIAYY